MARPHIPSALVLAGIELVLVIVAVMMLCFGFVTSVDKSGMFQFLLNRAYTEPRPFLFLTPPHQRAGQECTKSWVGTQSGQLIPTD